MRKVALSFVIAVSLAASMLPVLNAKAEDNWSLAWSDEFDGSSLNTSNWVYDVGTGSGGWGNNELQYYTNRTDNVRVENGSLIIEAKKENYGGMSYTSGRIKTQGLREFTYGKIEAKIKLPEGQGIWPAFWMLGANFSEVSWPYCGEIDIMEHVNNELQTHGTIHWDTSGYAYYGGTSSSIDVTQYHVYSVEWTSSSIKWLIDGEQFWEANIEDNVNGTEEFHKPFFLLLNLAVGGNWPGDPDSSTEFPAKMYVDYVRVYQKDATEDTGGEEESSEKLSSTTWYLFDQSDSSTTVESQKMQTTKSDGTGWQPTKTISSTPVYFTSDAIQGTYGKGIWNFELWTNSPQGDSKVTVELYQVSTDGKSQTLLGSQTKDIVTSGTGNHATTYTYSLNETAFQNQKLMIKIYKDSGTDAVMCYNTNDFPTKLVTP